VYEVRGNRAILKSTMVFPGFYSALKKIPGGQNVQVFVGTSFLLTLCAAPIFLKDTRPGHDLFSQEKPEAVQLHEEKLMKDYQKKVEKERVDRNKD